MANLVLTTRCNRDCAYCFAGRRRSGADMTLAQAGEVMDLALASGQRQVRFLGGEPTLHPDFAAMLDAAASRGLEVLVFSNGLAPPEAIKAILRMPPERCRMMLNLNLGVAIPEQERAHVAQTAQSLGARAFVGINIHSHGLPLQEASAFVKKHGLARTLRIGLAHPRLDRQNHYLHPRHYRRVGEELELFFKAVSPDGFSLSFDCGFVPCMFSPEFLESAGITVRDLGRRCGPIPDVLPDLSCLHCFPLGELDELPLSGVNTLQEIRELHAARTQAFSGIGIYRECAGCGLRQSGDCLGGCPSAAMLRAHRNALVVSDVTRTTRAKTALPVPAESSAKPWAIPYIDEPLGFWEALLAVFGPAIREVYFPIALPGIGTGRPLQPSNHLEELLRARMVPLAVLVNPLVLPGPLEQIGGRIVDELERLCDLYGLAAATLGDVRLAEMVRRRLPALHLTASCLLEVTEPGQAQVLRDLFDVLVPSTRVTRRPAHLAAIQSAFNGGRIRLLVNEGCLDSCLDRKQHFYEMASSDHSPESLCGDRLAREPWLRLTGAWVLPQHLDCLDPFTDEYKLAGRVTLREPEHYRRVLQAYVERRALWPHEIGGGPASVLSRTSVPRAHFQWMLRCAHTCADCSICRRAAAGHSDWEPTA